ncbi:MAG: tRNA dimethylallyltransferase [Verrucomicrobiota bacterium]
MFRFAYSVFMHGVFFVVGFTAICHSERSRGISHYSAARDVSTHSTIAQGRLPLDMTEEATRTFFIVGPTATGKSELAADVARSVDGEIVSADAFQIYRGFDLLTAKPDAVTLAKAPHHLIGTMSILEEMNVEKFRQLALNDINEIHSREKIAIVVGGSGLYVKALTHGLSVVPVIDAKLRADLNRLSLEQLQKRLVDLDPETARKIDMKNRRRVSRALEICLTGGANRSCRGSSLLPRGTVRAGRAVTASPTVSERNWTQHSNATGVFVFRDREDLHQRINQRVEAMLKKGVIEEARAIDEIGSTAAKMIGLREIRQHLEGKMSILQCVEKIQSATRQYAKRQLTWFRHQTSFEPLNISPLTHDAAVKWISQRARRSCAKG